MAENDLEDDALISQDDIDKLMESSPADEKEDEPQQEPAEQEEDQEDFSQEDIDSLLEGMDFDSKDSAREEAEQEEEDDEDDLDLISQEDINRLMNADENESEESSESQEIPEPEQDNGGPEEALPDTQEETGAAGEEPDPEPAAKEPAEPEVQEAEDRDNPESDEAEDDWLIGEAESVDIQESLLTQETLDELLAGKEEPVAEEEPEDPEETAEAPGPATEPEPEEEMEPVQQQEAYSRQEEESGATVVDLEEDELEDALPDGEEEPDTAQEDIDALLMDTEEDEAEEDEWDGDDLISQQDIEDLIMDSGGDEEDIGEDILSDTDADLDDEEEEDDYEEEVDTGGEEDSESEKIVLEATDADEGKPAEKGDAQSTDRDETGRRKWYKSRVFVLAASIVLVAGITISAGLFFLLSGEGPEPPAAPSQERVVRKVTPEAESDVDTVDIDLENAEPAAQNEVATAPEPSPAVVRETILMKDFVVLAPDSAEGLVYIRADLSIDYSGEQAYNNTRNNMSYFRDVVYTSIRGAFESGKGDGVTQSELLTVVQEALKRELPSSQIREISFKTFKAG